jgi:hypothetical protein
MVVLSEGNMALWSDDFAAAVVVSRSDFESEALEHRFVVHESIERCPVLLCANEGCRSIFWPWRPEPKSKCMGTPS